MKAITLSAGPARRFGYGVGIRRPKRNVRLGGEQRCVRGGAALNAPQLASDEPLSPELVLVLPAELRARVIAELGPPVWPKAAPRVVAAPAPPPALPAPPTILYKEPFRRSVGAMLLARAAQLAVIFLTVTILVLVMSLVANAMR